MRHGYRDCSRKPSKAFPSLPATRNSILKRAPRYWPRFILQQKARRTPRRGDLGRNLGGNWVAVYFHHPNKPPNYGFLTPVSSIRGFISLGEYANGGP